MAKNKQPYEIGSKHFYPSHGVVSLVAVEEREFAGTAEEFHVLELLRGGTLLVPTKAMAQTTLRPLISAKKARELKKRMRSKPKVRSAESAGEGKERARRYEEQLKQGDADDYTDILHDLLLSSIDGKITLSEQRLLETARGFFVDELGAVLNIDVNQFLVEVAKAAAPVSAAESEEEEEEEDDDDDE